MIRYTINEACAKLGITRQTLHERIKKAGIKPVKEGRYSYLTDDQLHEVSSSVSNISGKDQVGTGNVSGKKFHVSGAAKDEMIEFLKEQNKYLQAKLDEQVEMNKNNQVMVMTFQKRNQELEQKLLESPRPIDGEAEEVTPGIIERVLDAVNWKDLKKARKKRKK